MENLYAIISTDNKALNFIMCDGQNVSLQEGERIVRIPDGTAYGYGWLWNDTEFVPPSVVTTVPETITPRQARLMLLQMNMLASVNSMIAAQDDATKIAWEYSLEFRRDNDLLNALAATLSWTDEALDQFFIAAAVL